MLLEYLVISDFQTLSGTDPLKFDLAEAIAACRSAGILSQRAADLSSVVRGYRNLIHPGRVARLDEVVDKNTATVAQALVEIVIDEISRARTASYSFPAEQLINKLIIDRTALTVLHHFLKDTTEFEHARLVRLIPGRYFEIERDAAVAGADGFDMSEALAALRKCFRQTFATLNAENKRSALKQFVNLLREADEDRVLRYETTFFVGSDLEFLPEQDAALAKDHFLSRLADYKKISEPVVEALDGIGPFLSLPEISRLTDSLMRVLLYHRDESLQLDAKFALAKCNSEIPSPNDHALIECVDGWIKKVEQRGSPAQLEEAKSAKEFIEEFF